MSHSKTIQPLTVVSADVPREAVDSLLDTLAEKGFSPTAWDDVERPAARVDIFLTDAADAGAASDALAAAVRALGLDLRPVVSTLPPQDWAESWKRFFHVQRVSKRIVVRPSWEPHQAKPGDCVIELDPGMSFGTGNHATTRACLMLIDALAAQNTRRSVLDMGCGSGILAIAARKLDFDAVSGFDNDPYAVQVARENAAINGADAAFYVDDLAGNCRRADVVVANILAVVLIEHATAVAAAVNPSGALVLSGILNSQYPAVRAAYLAQGFAETRSLLIAEWRTGLFTQP